MGGSLPLIIRAGLPLVLLRGPLGAKIVKDFKGPLVSVLLLLIISPR